MDRPLCSVCGVNKTQPTGKNKQYWRKKCTKCSETPEQRKQRIDRVTARRRPWQPSKKDYCEKCGFVASHPCQLDVDHIDGDKNNNDPSNFQTLCANCHRLKTWENQEYKQPGERGKNVVILLS